MKKISDMTNQEIMEQLENTKEFKSLQNTMKKFIDNDYNRTIGKMNLETTGQYVTLPVFNNSTTPLYIRAKSTIERIDNMEDMAKSIREQYESEMEKVDSGTTSEIDDYYQDIEDRLAYFGVPVAREQLENMSKSGDLTKLEDMLEACEHYDEIGDNDKVEDLVNQMLEYVAFY